jgi:hypothetical protein
MALTPEQLLERMTRTQLVMRQKSRRKRGGRTNVVVVGGKVRHVTAKMRKAFRRAGSHLRRMAKNAGVRRRAAKTSKIYARLMAKRSYAESVVHIPAYIEAVTEFTTRTGMIDVGEALLKHMDTKLTSTPLGVYALDVSEKLDSTPSVAGAFIDCTLLDENTVGFYFENHTALNEGTIERALSEFGKVSIVATPGKKISEDEVSDLYAVALEVAPDRLSKVEVSEKFTYDEDDQPQLDEAQNLSEDDTDAICRNPVFQELNKLLA